MSAGNKAYKPFTKVIAVILMIIAILTFFGTMGILSEMDDYAEYDSYCDWEIVGASSEKQEDGSYLITVDIKNNSSYQAHIQNNTITIEYGDNRHLENQTQPYPDGHLYNTLNETLVPAGRTVKHQICVNPPEGINTIRLRYFGVDYKKSRVLGEERDYSFYTIKL